MTDKITVLEARQAAAIGKKVLLQGWVRTRREANAELSFIELNDGSCLGNIQLVADNSLDEYESVVRMLTVGSSISVTGEVIESPGKQPTEVKAISIELIGESDPDTYPIQKKRSSFEFLRTVAHLRPRTNTFGAIARVRNQVSASIHQYFQENGFLYIHTPIITTSDCEGAGEMFQATTLDLKRLAAADKAELDYKFDFFDRPAYLTVSGQLEAEIFATSLGKVYTYGPTFRAENSNTPRHLAEFWMIEPEMAFCDLFENMSVAEGMIRRILTDVLNNCDEDLQLFNRFVQKGIIGDLEKVVKDDFVRMEYTEAIAILEKCGEKFDYPVEWGIDLQSEHEKFLAEKHVGSPVILYNYPRTIKPFYMYLNDDEKTVRAMDILVPGIGEIVGGSEREYRLPVLEERMKDQDLNPEDYWWYTDLRRYGTVPHSGFGLGFERMTQYVTGMSNIRDISPLPRTPGNAEF